MRKRRPMTGTLVLSLLVGSVVSLGGCQEKGPAESVGEAMDQFKDDVADTFDPKGPAEKAGRAIDRAVDR